MKTSMVGSRRIHPTNQSPKFAAAGGMKHQQRSRSDGGETTVDYTARKSKRELLLEHGLLITQSGGIR